MTRAMTGKVIKAGTLGLFLAGLVACGIAVHPTVWTPGNRQPLIHGWQQFFRLQWDAAKKGELTDVEGYITNVWGFTAQRIQFLVTGYDTAGRPLGQIVAWGPYEVDPGSRQYFSVPVPPGASTYDVAVFAWDWVQTGGAASMP